MLVIVDLATGVYSGLQVAKKFLKNGFSVVLSGKAHPTIRSLTTELVMAICSGSVLLYFSCDLATTAGLMGGFAYLSSVFV